jgi:competence ComEA-like helix-hairpin-helix protein
LVIFKPGFEISFGEISLMNWKQLVKDYFFFTRKERIGLSIILILVLAIWISPRLISSGNTKAVTLDTSWISEAKKLQHQQQISQRNSKQDEEEPDEFVYDKPVNEHPVHLEQELFYFDPNSLPQEGWKKLGIREKTITTIQKYLSKGGHFYQKEDLKKIYGFQIDDYKRLEPYVKINDVNHVFNHRSTESKQKKESQTSSSRNNAIDINTADTSEFIALPGIGAKLASRIIGFREKLGGFYSIDQISEIYGLRDSTFQKIKPLLRLDEVTVRKFNINTATKDELKSHPYIKWNLANAIVEYRNQHGNFSSLEDLKKISVITDDAFNKMKNYLAL